MPRPLRLNFQGAWYHVMNRGAAHKTIYKTDKHRQLFLSLLRESTLYHNIEIHAFCLMGNHYHLLINTPLGNLSEAMRQINGVYTQEFNRSEKIDGPLFRGRFKSILVEEDSYLLQVSRYIHLNPVSAGITDKAEHYLWSSYKDYLSTSTSLPWLSTQLIKDMVSVQNKELGYQEFVENGVDENTKHFYSRKKIPVVFGENLFKNRSLSMIPSLKLKHSKPDYNKTYEPLSLAFITQICAKYYNIDEALLYSYRKGRLNIPRQITMYISRAFGQSTLDEIARFFNCKSKSGASNAVSKIRNLLKTDDVIKNEIQQIEKILIDINYGKSQRYNSSLDC